MNPTELKKLILVLEIADIRQQRTITNEKLSYELHNKIHELIYDIEMYAEENNIVLDY